MDSIPFSLVSNESPNAIFAFGLELVHDGEQIEAVTYRRDPSSGQASFGVHASAEAACRRYGIVTPLTLRWQDEEQEADVPGR